MVITAYKGITWMENDPWKRRPGFTWYCAMNDVAMPMVKKKGSDL